MRYKKSIILISRKEKKNETYENKVYFNPSIEVTANKKEITSIRKCGYTLANLQNSMRKIKISYNTHKIQELR